MALTSVAATRTASPPRVAVRLDSLTGLRFFAAYMVLIHHFSNFSVLPLVWRWYGFGTTGVSFFFVLSGFVLTWSFVPSDTPPRFYWRRFARIWPLHAITTLLAIPVFYMGRDIPMNWRGVILSFFLLHAWIPAPSIYFAGNPASWSLSCEMFFYGLHPFLVRRILALRLLLLAAGTGLVLVLLYVLADSAAGWPSPRISGWFLYVSPVFRLGEFVIGMVLAAAVRRGFRSPIGLLPAVALLAAWFFVRYSLSPHAGADLQLFIASANYPALAAIYTLIIAATVRLDLDGRFSPLRWKPAVLLGQWSYSLYLVHASIIYLLAERLGPQYSPRVGALWLVLVTALAVAASAGLYYAVERPIERRLRAMLAS